MVVENASRTESNAAVILLEARIWFGNRRFFRSKRRDTFPAVCGLKSGATARRHRARGVFGQPSAMPVARFASQIQTMFRTRAFSDAVVFEDIAPWIRFTVQFLLPEGFRPFVPMAVACETTFGGSSARCRQWALPIPRSGCMTCRIPDSKVRLMVIPAILR